MFVVCLLCTMFRFRLKAHILVYNVVCTFRIGLPRRISCGSPPCVLRGTDRRMGTSGQTVFIQVVPGCGILFNKHLACCSSDIQFVAGCIFGSICDLFMSSEDCCFGWPSPWRHCLIIPLYVSWISCVTHQLWPFHFFSIKMQCLPCQCWWWWFYWQMQLYHT